MSRQCSGRRFRLPPPPVPVPARHRRCRPSRCRRCRPASRRCPRRRSSRPCRRCRLVGVVAAGQAREHQHDGQQSQGFVRGQAAFDVALHGDQSTAGLSATEHATSPGPGPRTPAWLPSPANSSRPSFQGRSIDVANLSPELRKDLGRRRHHRRRAASRSPAPTASSRATTSSASCSRRSTTWIATARTGRSSPATPTGKTTQAGALLADLRAEVEKNRLRTPVSTAKTSTPPSPATVPAAKPATKADPRRHPGWTSPARRSGRRSARQRTSTTPYRRVPRHAPRGKFNDDETAWCSSFVNWVMEKSGNTGTDSALALSWKNYGTKSDGPVRRFDRRHRPRQRQRSRRLRGRPRRRQHRRARRQPGRLSLLPYVLGQDHRRIPAAPGYQPPAGPLPEITIKDNKPVSFSETR